MAEEYFTYVAGYLAPEGTPESDCYKASVRLETARSAYEAACERVEREGCPPIPRGKSPKWDGMRWHLVDREGK